MSGETVLIVEDNMIVAMMVEDVLKDEGYRLVPTAETSVAALDAVEKERPDLVLVDLDLEYKAAGIDVARKLNELAIPALYLTGQQELARSHPDLALGLIAKPVLPPNLLSCVRAAIDDPVGSMRTAIDGCEWFDSDGAAPSSAG